MKRILPLILLAAVLLPALAFRPAASIDNVISALRSGNATELSRFMDENLDLELPDRSDNYSKSQAVLILKDFFTRNGVNGFEVKHKGDKSGNQYCIGFLQTKAGTYRTTIFMKAQGGKQLIKEIKFLP